MSRTLRIFRSLPALDAFVVTDEYHALAERLGLAEWHPVVWIGRLFPLDNDYGDHWFDHGDEREEKAQEAHAVGIAPEDLWIIHPERITDDKDGPCHPPEIRKRFWTDVRISLERSYPLLFEEACLKNHKVKDILPEAYIEDLEARIAALQATEDLPTQDSRHEST